MLKKIGEGINPIKSLINKEAHFQGILHGTFSYYSDIKLKEEEQIRELVLTEFQTGVGGRIDMLIQAIGSSAQGTTEYTPVGLELKYDDSIKLTQIQGNNLLKITNAEQKFLKDKGKKRVKNLVDEQLSRYAQGAALKAITDSNKVVILGVVFNAQAKDDDSLLLTSDSFIHAMVVHSSTTIITPAADKKPREVLHELTNKFKNLGVQQDNCFLEEQTRKGNYNYWLQQHDLADIARIEYNYGTDTANTLFEIIGSPEHLTNQLKQFQTKVNQGEIRPLTLVINLENNHWVTLVINHQNEQYHGYYEDSLGSHIPNNIREILQQRQITNDNIHDIHVSQQTDGYNCGLWALENARDINTMLRENRNVQWLTAQLV